MKAGGDVMAYYNKNHNTPCYGTDTLSIAKRLLRMNRVASEVNTNKFDLNKYATYECKGYDLIGSSSNTKDSDRHFIVKNNRYRVFEFPAKSNSGLRMTGRFLCVMKNLDYGFWIIAEMNHSFRESRFGNMIENVRYFCYGEFELTITDSGLSYKCITGTGKCCRGYKGKIFDGDNVRKESGYHTTWSVINKRNGRRSV